MISLIITAAGSGKRAGLGINKLLYKVSGKTVLQHTLACFDFLQPDLTVITANQDTFWKIKEIASDYGAEVVLGGDSRTLSVRQALWFVSERVESLIDEVRSTRLSSITDQRSEELKRLCRDKHITVIHDGARPNVSPEIIYQAVKSAALNGSGVAALPLTDSLSLLSGEPVDRDLYRRIQTPQAFNFDKLAAAYRETIGDFSDDSAVYYKRYMDVRLIDGSEENVKLTYKEDIERLFGSRRSGIGFDIHPLTEGRPLILCGVKLPHKLGLSGHSDADVCLHALMDAILSAAGERDIGHFFPSTPEYRNADSSALLKSVLDVVAQMGLSPLNVSLSIIAESPRIAPHIGVMKSRLAAMLSISEDAVGISATTAEKLGDIGSNAAIACYASALLG